MADNREFEPGLFYNQGNEIADNPEKESVEEVVNDADTLEEEEANPAEEEAQEEEADAEAEESDEEGESLYIEFDNEEVSYDDVSEWKQAFKDRKSMQADYTRKMQDLSKRAEEKAREIVGGEVETLKDLVAEMEAAIQVDDDTDLEDLRQYDPGEYLRLKELKEKREKLVKDARAKLDNVKASNADVQAEHKKLVGLHPDWFDGDKMTEAYNSDMKLVQEYVKENKWSTDEFNAVVTATNFDAILKAAKYDRLQSKAKSAKKKVRSFAKPKPSSKRDDKPVEKSLTDYFYN